MDSVARQTYQNIEMLVVDDGSVDNTLEVLEDWSANRPAFALKVIKQNNAGVSAARNAGIAASSGEFVYFLDSDDLIYPEALQELVTPLRESSAPYVLANIWNADINGNILHAQKSGISSQCPNNIFWNCWMTHAALYRRDILGLSGHFNESLKTGEDKEFHWRLIASAGLGLMLDKRIGLRRLHHLGHLSANRSHADSVEVIEAYADWLEEPGRKDQSLSSEALESIFALALRCGKDGEFALKSRAIVLLERFSRKDSIRTKIITFIGMYDSKTYFALLLAVAENINTFRSFILSFGDFLPGGPRTSQPKGGRTKPTQKSDPIGISSG
tara:strand:+ start:10912 stop:11898 length:987 start_codon:yes stop_codon:yes gene_type:complete